MKPRTKLEKTLQAWSAQLPPLTQAQRRYAYALFARVGYYWKSGKVWCQCCGHVYQELLPELAVSMEAGDTCPACGASLTLRHWREGQREYTEAKYFSTLRPWRGWMVVRTFHVSRGNRMGQATQYAAREVYQNWVSPQGREFIMGRRYTRSPFHMAWDYDSPMDVKKHNGTCTGYYQMEDVFLDRYNDFYPRAAVTPTLRRNGWDARILRMGVSAAQAISQLLGNPVAETVAKQGQWDVLAWMLRRGDRQLPYRHAINICHRHGYTIGDAQLYFDYLDLLSYLGLDTHNPRYLCPPDLRREHDRLAARKDKAEALRRERERAKEMAEAENRYRQDKAPFLGLGEFGDGTVSLHVLSGVAEFYDEGREMHHCVYTNAYYNRADSLILSATVGGRRTETVEVSLRTFDVVQSRGPCNRATEWHDRIVSLVRDNMHLIRQAAKKADKLRTAG